MSTGSLQPAEVFPLGVHLSEELEARGWTMTEFAKRCDLDHRVVQAILEGAIPINKASAARMATALGVSADFLQELDRSYRAWQKSKS